MIDARCRTLFLEFWAFAKSSNPHKNGQTL